MTDTTEASPANIQNSLPCYEFPVELADYKPFFEQNPGINVCFMDSSKLFQLLNKKHTDEQFDLQQSFGNSFAVCIDGIRRSSLMMKFLKQLDIPLAHTVKNDWGYPLQLLVRKTEKGTVAADGKITPQGFELPLDTLFVTIEAQNGDNSAVEQIHLRGMFDALKQLKDRTNEPLAMNIIIANMPVPEADILEEQYVLQPDSD